MNIKLKCICGATCWTKGTLDSQGDGVMAGDFICEVDGDREWEGGNPACSHDDYVIVDHEYDNPFEDEL